MQVVSTRVYARRATKLLSEAERRKAEDEIAGDPLYWPVIRGTGGLRKARVARGGSGKRGGARIVYYYWTDGETIYLLTIYAKNEKQDLTLAERKALKKIVDSLKEHKND